MTEYYYKVETDTENFVGIWDNIPEMVKHLSSIKDGTKFFIDKIELGVDYRTAMSPMYWWYDEFLNTPLAIEALKSGE